jgi:hypothetical protein
MINMMKDWIFMYPVTRLDLTNEPEEDIDIEEEKGIGKEKRVVIAPCP